MYVHPGNLVYIAHTKTASTSIADALVKKEWKLVGGHHEIQEDLINKDTKVISVIRDPMDWYISWYDHYRSRDEFFDWLEWFLDNTHRMLEKGDFPGLPLTTHLVFFEGLQSGFNSVFDDLGLDRITFSHMNVGPRLKGYEDLYWGERSLKLLDKRKFKLLLLYEGMRSVQGSRLFLPMKGHARTLALDYELGTSSQ